MENWLSWWNSYQSLSTVGTVLKFAGAIIGLLILVLGLRKSSLRKAIASKTLGKIGTFTVIKAKSGKWTVGKGDSGKIVGSALSQASVPKRTKKLKLGFSAEDAEFHNKIAEAAAKDFLE